jgi:hypothetical protein
VCARVDVHWLYTGLRENLKSARALRRRPIAGRF